MKLLLFLTANAVRTSYIFLLLSSLAAAGLHAQSSQTRSNVETPSPLISVMGSINASSEVVNDILRKGSSVEYSVEKNKRYAVIAQSNSLDTVVRLALSDIDVYRDLYLGELAGIVFSPALSGIAEFTAFAHNAQFTNEEAQQADMGHYILKIFELHVPPEKIKSLPYTEKSELQPGDSIALRVAEEYSLQLEQDQRLYIYMQSSDFDPLLEISDRFGRSIIADDWEERESIITLLAPFDDEFFITASSFDGTGLGAYFLELHTSKNELVLTDSGNVSAKDQKILSYYFRQYELDMKEGSYYSVEVQAWDGELILAFADSNQRFIVEYSIEEGEKLTLPLRARQSARYLLMFLSQNRAVVNYSFSVYR